MYNIDDDHVLNDVLSQCPVEDMEPSNIEGHGAEIASYDILYAIS